MHEFVDINKIPPLQELDSDYFDYHFLLDDLTETVHDMFYIVKAAILYFVTAIEIDTELAAQKEPLGELDARSQMDIFNDEEE